MGNGAVEAVALRKSFKGHDALRGLDLQVPAGSIFGFLGRNGAGKTTTIKLLMGLLKPDGGEASVLGLPVGNASQQVEARRRIGFVTEDKELYPYMTVAQMIRFTRPFFPKWRSDLEQQYLDAFDLPPNRKIPALSKGMRSKLMLLLAIAHDAELLILDEPMEGLDPAAAEDVLAALTALAAAEGTTIFFSSTRLPTSNRLPITCALSTTDEPWCPAPWTTSRRGISGCTWCSSTRRADRVQWVDGVDKVRQEGRMLSILASRNTEAVLQQIRSLPGASVERFPVTLKEIFLEHVRSH